MTTGLAPLYMVCGAPGAGKTALAPMLVERASGLVVLDMDELLEDGALLGVPIATRDAVAIWPAYDRMWRRIVDAIRRSGHPVLLLRPTPSADDLTPGRHWTEPTSWALLDCADTERIRRLTTRGWQDDAVADALTDAARARAMLPTIIQTDDAGPATVTGHILAWAGAQA